jgi:hypothetical protein
LQRFPVHQELYHKLIEFTEMYSKKKKLWELEGRAILSIEQTEKRHMLKQKASLHDALKGLLFKMTHCPET